MFTALHNVVVNKIAVALPQKMVRYDDELYENIDAEKKERLKKIIGFENRYVAKEETALDLCEAAALKLELSASAVDALIFITQTPDYFQPGNAAILHGRLNLKKDCFCQDINAGCNGYIQGLFQAHLLLQQEEINAVLLCVGDTISKTINSADPTTAPIFGDGGSATLLTKKIGYKSYFSFHTDGTKYDQIMIRNGAYKNRTNNPDDNFLFMDGAEVMQMAIAEVPQSISNLIAKFKLEKEDIDIYFFHQANNFIVETLAKNLKISLHKAPLVFSKFGNQSSASIPFTMADTLRKMHAKQCLLSGFGVGFAWANAIIDVSDLEIYF